MNLVEEFTLKLKTAAPVPVGQVRGGMRMAVEITGGEISGDRVKGKVLGGGGDWALIDAQGMLNIDVRAQIATDDGAFMYVQYTGFLEMNEKFQIAAGTGKATEFGDNYFFSNPRIECGDERYAWVNNTFFVAQGCALEGGGVEYKVYRAES